MLGIPMVQVATQQALRIERIEDEAEFAALRESWNSLLAETPNQSVFLSWEWLATVWRYRAPDSRLCMLVARDPLGRVAGIAPWALFNQRMGPLRVRRIGFAGTDVGYVPHLDILAREDERELVCSAFRRHLQITSGDWDALDLANLAGDSPLRRCLSTVCRRYVETPVDPAPTILLPDSWERYLQEHLSSHRRRRLRADQKKIEADYPGLVSYRRVADLAELPQVMNALVVLSQQRWRERGMVSSFERDRFAAFHHDMAAVALQQGWLRLYYLKVGEQIVAVDHAFCFGDRVYGYQRAFAADWERYSPGQLLFAYALRDAIRDGACEYDLLIGANQSKSSWAGDERVDYRVMGSRGLAGELWLLGQSLMHSAQPLAREHLSPQVRWRLQQLVIREH